MYEPRLCNKYIKWLDAFIDVAKKDMLYNIRENIYCFPNIARMRRDIVQIMC
jgi:hypothetical protein